MKRIRGKVRRTQDLINLKLGLGDEDIKTWWQGLPAGKGGVAVRAAIRAAMTKKPDAGADLAAVVAGALAAMQQEIKALRVEISRLKSTGVIAAESADVREQARLTEQQAEARKQKVKERNW